MKKLITITLAILLTISVCQCTDAKTENGAIWSYPMTNYSIEWEKLESYAERAEINQIPDSIISSVSTGELLRLVEDYPLLYTVHLYDNPRDAYNVLYDTFNGFRELMSREAWMKLLKNIIRLKYLYKLELIAAIWYQVQIMSRIIMLY